MKCEFLEVCKPEVLRSCCRNAGLWNDKRRKNYGKECVWHTRIKSGEEKT